MDLKIQRDISNKIIGAVKSNDSVAIIKALEECVNMYLEEIKQAVNGHTYAAIPCVLAALKKPL